MGRHAGPGPSNSNQRKMQEAARAWGGGNRGCPGAVQEFADGSPCGRSSQRVDGTTERVCGRTRRIHHFSLVESLSRNKKALGVLESKWDLLPLVKKRPSKYTDTRDLNPHLHETRKTLDCGIGSHLSKRDLVSIQEQET